eukprot:2807825-Rhodomonas_salina.2
MQIGPHSKSSRNRTAILVSGVQRLWFLAFDFRVCCAIGNRKSGSDEQENPDSARDSQPEQTVRDTSSSATCLAPRYAMPGTEILYGAASLRGSYALSGTEMPYGAASLRGCYAMSGTEMLCGATSQPSEK